MITCANCGALVDEQVAFGVCPRCGEDLVSDDSVQTARGNRYIDPQWLTRGTVLHGVFEIIDVIGAGGFGITYKAVDRRSGAFKAIKEFFQQAVCNRIPGTRNVIISALKRRDEFEYGKKRFLEEARIVAGFGNVKSIVKIDDYFEENNTAYMVMEYIEDEILEDFIVNQRRLLTPEQATEVGIQICEALKRIHKAGVIHRDIAPDNIFINKDMEVKIIDFGSARLSRDDTAEKMIVLKPGFAPPEQYERISKKSDKQQAWTDIYAVGATLYFALTGIKPIEASDRKIAANAGKDPLAYPSEINKNIPEHLSNAIMTAMAINIHERFQDAESFEKALNNRIKVERIEVKRRKRRIRRLTGISVAVMIVAIISVTAVLYYRWRVEKEVLPKAEISMWFIAGKDSTMSQQKERAINSVIDVLKESEKFSEVTIELKSFNEDQYISELKSASANGSMPTLFEQPQNSGFMVENIMDIDELYKRLPKRECYYLEEYGNRFCETDAVPMAFNVPVIYVNTRYVEDCTSETLISSVDDFFALSSGEMRYKDFGINPAVKDNYIEMLPGIEEYLDESSNSSLEDFIGGRSAAYLSDTSDYYLIRNSEALQLSFEMLPLKTENVICEFVDYWSLGNATETETVCAKAVLEYFFTNNGQTIYYSGQNAGLPLEKQALRNYIDYQTTVFKPLIDDYDKYVFKP